MIKPVKREFYADEEVPSNRKYSPKYKGARPIEKQVEIIAKVFKLSSLGALKFIKEILPTFSLPQGAEGWFAIPNLDAMVFNNFCGSKEIMDSDIDVQYCAAVKLVVLILRSFRPVRYERTERLTPSQLRQHVRTVCALTALSEMQKNEVLIIPAQLGFRYRGCSPRRAREKFAPNEFGLGVLAMASILMTHLERLEFQNELEIDCSGDEFSIGGNIFDLVPSFSSSSGFDMVFSARPTHARVVWHGSASGFLPAITAVKTV